MLVQSAVALTVVVLVVARAVNVLRLSGRIGSRLRRRRSPCRVPANDPTVLDVLDLEEIDRDLYRSRLVFADRFPLYGGQVAAQALLAAGGTVPPERLPHSLHGYFLRSGDAARPTVFRVDRDRDGGSFSARRVVALQGGEVDLQHVRVVPGARARAGRAGGARLPDAGGSRTSCRR